MEGVGGERGLVEQQDYFHGALWRAAAEALLRSCPRGAFLVRTAGPELEPDLVLSIKVREHRSSTALPPTQDAAEEEEEEEDEDFGELVGVVGVLHQQIQVDSRGYFTVDGTYFFGSVGDLVAQHLEEWVCEETGAAVRRRPVAFSAVRLGAAVGRARWELLPDHLRLGPVLKASRFGTLYQGHLLGAGPQPLKVSIKVMDVRKSEHHKRMFLSDALAFGLLPRDKRILTFHGVCLLSDEMRLAKELSELGTLRGWLETREAELGLREAVDLAEQMASALAFVHAEGGLVHLDVTSLNFFLFEGGRGGPRAKLGNFYHARRPRRCPSGAVGSLVLRAETLAGLEPRWAAGEVLAGEAVGQPADVFSLAVCVGELLWDPPGTPFPMENMSDGAGVVKRLRVRLDSGKPHPVPSRLPLRLRSLLGDAWQRVARLRPSAALFRDELRRTKPFL